MPDKYDIGVDIPGQLYITFKTGVTVNQAESLITDNGLHFRQPKTIRNSLRVTTVILVEQGKEQEWIDRLVSFPEIESVRRVTLMRFTRC